MSKEILKNLFERNSFKLNDEVLDKFSLYAQELLRWNKVHNITAVKDFKGIVLKHFLDSLTLVKCFEKLNLDPVGKSVADVGSGGGFPGVPLKLYYKDLNLTLIESSSKKCSFLEYLKVRLKESWRVECKRAENVEGKFNIVVARALGPFEDVAPLLESLSLGWVFILKGKEIPENRLGFEICRVELPDIPSRVILYKKKKAGGEPA